MKEVKLTWGEGRSGKGIVKPQWGRTGKVNFRKKQDQELKKHGGEKTPPGPREGGSSWEIGGYPRKQLKRDIRAGSAEKSSEIGEAPQINGEPHGPRKARVKGKTNLSIG